MSQPVVWTVTGYRAGEKTQIIALADALGWSFETKRLAHKPIGAVGQLLRRVTLAGIDPLQSSPLAPPWPDLVISAGLRNEPVCRWIREQSGNHTRLVHVGRPWAPLGCFDLVVTTPQYRLPDRPNVLHNSTTLHRLTAKRLAVAAQEYRDQVSHLPRPLVAVIIGGNTGPYTFGKKAARRLATELNRMAGDSGGAVLVSTSARTPADATTELKARLAVPTDFYQWTADAGYNPYYSYLALADSIVVTADSIAMLSEACATEKPVYMFGLDPAEGHGPGGQEDFRLAALLYRWMMRWGPQRLSRDVGIVHRALQAQGRAVWVGDRFPDRAPPPLTDLERAVSRVKALFPDASSAHESPTTDVESAAVMEK